jgi:glycosyltransferase involved in cell wall biosynthesis
MDEFVVRLAVTEGREHSLYRELLAAPPEGVKYITDRRVHRGDRPTGKDSISHRARRNSLVRAVLDPVFVRSLPNENRPPHGLALGASRAVTRLAGGRAADAKQRIPFDVFHSAGSSCIENIPWFVEKDVRWVVDFEFVASLFGYYGDWRRRIYRPRSQKMLTKVLASRYCTKIMPWTDAARKTLEYVLPSETVSTKTEVVRLAVRPAPPKPADIEKHDNVRILFMGSSNYGGEFYSKGGLDVLEAYRLLRGKMGDQVELYFRCWMPDELRDRYASTPGLHTLSELLPRDSLDRLFWESDMFLFPSHNTPGMAFLEAMRFGLPIVGRDLWANNELVKDGVHGFLVKPSENVPYYLPGFVPNWSMDDGPFLPYMKKIDERVVADLVDRLARLVEDENLRKRMGDAGRKEVEEGQASVGRRNAALRRIYEESAKR